MNTTELIKCFEGLSLKPYKCPAGVWTIGYGHVIPSGDIAPITEEEADILLEADIQKTELQIIQRTKVILQPHHLAALTSFVFNVGIAAYTRSTLRQKLNIGHFGLVPQEFNKWVYGGGRKLPGLIMRRQLEADIFSGNITLNSLTIN